MIGISYVISKTKAPLPALCTRTCESRVERRCGTSSRYYEIYVHVDRRSTVIITTCIAPWGARSLASTVGVPAPVGGEIGFTGRNSYGTIHGRKFSQCRGRNITTCTCTCKASLLTENGDL